MRREDWPSRLAAYLTECEGKEFKWGEFDCALFAAGAVEAMTGVDHATAYRGKYDSAQGAARLLGGGLGHVVDAAGFGRIPPLYAQRGDVALMPTGTNGRESLGVVTGEHVALPSEDGGLTYYPLKNALVVWRIS